MLVPCHIRYSGCFKKSREDVGHMDRRDLWTTQCNSVLIKFSKNCVSFIRKRLFEILTSLFRVKKCAINFLDDKF